MNDVAIRSALDDLRAKLAAVDAALAAGELRDAFAALDPALWAASVQRARSAIAIPIAEGLMRAG